MSSNSISVNELSLIAPLKNSWTQREWLLLLGLLAVTFGLYFQTHRFDFIYYDDYTNIFRNPHVIQGLTAGNLRWALTAVVTSNWHPVTLLCWLAISSLFGLHAGAFHLFNACVHAINTGLVFVFFMRATGRTWPAVFTAALWGLHPLRVESVAWISETKDVLCGMFWLLCILAYLRYTRRRTLWGYLLVVVLDILALLSKPMAVTLPGTLLLLDFWPLRCEASASSQWWIMRVIEKFPLLVFSALLSYFTIRVQEASQAIKNLSVFPLVYRIDNALAALWAYLAEFAFPRRLGLFHPHPAMIAGGHVSLMAASLGAGLLVGLSIGACAAAKRYPYLVVGWFWFMGTLVPVIGLVQVGEQSHADRYTYIPAIGLTMAVVFLASDLARKPQILRLAAVFAGATAVIVLSVVSCGDIGYWRDTQTVFTRADEVIPNNYVAKSLRASRWFGKDHTAETLQLTADAVKISPQNVDVLVFRGLALMYAGKLEDALAVLTTAKDLNPYSATTWKDLGEVRAQQADQCLTQNKPGETELRKRSIMDFENAVYLDPDMLEAKEYLAEQNARIGNLQKAIPIWQQLVEILPQDATAQGHLADALRLTDDLRGAVEHYAAAIADGSTNPAWETNLAYLTATNPQATADQLRSVLPIARHACEQTGNMYPGELDALAACLARMGRFDDAINTAKQAIDRANQLKQPAIAKGIQMRLARYQRGLAYVAGDQ